MPELPEIETVKLQLSKYLIGQKLTELKKLHLKTVQGNVKLILGKEVIGVERRGKMLIIELSNNFVLAMHFKMSGQLILVRKAKNESNTGNLTNRIVGGHPSADWLGTLPSKHTRAIFNFDSGDTMYFNDQRIFGWIKILTRIELEALPFLQKLGKELWDMTEKEFHATLTKRKKAVKLVLMDQEAFSGVGNIYANDGLWEARLNPARSAETLTLKESTALYHGTIKVLEEGIKYGGATASDAKYINLHGLGGHYQEHFKVYARNGTKCLRGDGGIIKKTTLGGRGTYFCPVCQK